MSYYIGSIRCVPSDELQHFGIKGMHWGIRRFQNEDGSLTNAGKARYNDKSTSGNTPKSTKVAKTAGAATGVAAGVAGAAHLVANVNTANAVRKIADASRRYKQSAALGLLGAVTSPFNVVAGVGSAAASMETFRLARENVIQATEHLLAADKGLLVRNIAGGAAVAAGAVAVSAMLYGKHKKKQADKNRKETK